MALLCGFSLALVLGVAPAKANRTLITDRALGTLFCLRCPPPPLPPVQPPLEPPPDGQIEGACGIAIASSGELYVSDYYHHLVDVFGANGIYKSQFAVNPLNGVCQLAFDGSDSFYANQWHESVVRLKPTFKVFDEDESTGVAVDASGNVYVNDRTYVAVYEPSGAPVLDEGQPLKIGLGSLGDAYGLAVFFGRVYVPDAATDTVEVFEPAIDPDNPIDSIAAPGGFKSLIDASVTVDPTNGHVLVLDNLQPGFEHPKGAIVEFDEDGTFLGQLQATVIHSEPSGMAVDPLSGRLFVTDGNSEGANAFVFGAYGEPGPGPGETAPLGGGSLSVGTVVRSEGASSADVGTSVSGSMTATARRRAGRRHKPARWHRAGRHLARLASVSDAVRALP